MRDKILRDATEYFSRQTTSLPTVIPAMDHIDHEFTANAANPRYLKSIRSSLLVAKKTLNRYYSLTDASQTYRITMSKPKSHFVMWYYVNDIILKFYTQRTR